MEEKTFGIQLIRVILRICIRLHVHRFYKDFQPRGFDSRWQHLVSLLLNNANTLEDSRIFSFTVIKKVIRNAGSGPVGRKTAAIRGSYSHYHLNSPPLTGTAKSASFSRKKHRRKRHSALCCGHYLFRGIVKAVVIGGRGGEGERERERRRVAVCLRVARTRAPKGWPRRQPLPPSTVGIGEPRSQHRRSFRSSRGLRRRRGAYLLRDWVKNSRFLSLSLSPSAVNDTRARRVCLNLNTPVSLK